MEGLQIFLAVLLGVVSRSPDQISASVLDVIVRPGDNITLFCDCKLSTGVYIMWLRNCSHESQPSLVLKPALPTGDINNPRYKFVRNFSSQTYDLLIMNVTDSDEGLYYCGTHQKMVEDKELYITSRYIYRYGNTTNRILLDKNSDPDSSHKAPAVPWMLVFTPAFTIFSSFLSLMLVYHICQKTEKASRDHQKRPNTRGQTKRNQDRQTNYQW